MSQIVLYFLHTTSVLSFHINVVLTLSIPMYNIQSPCTLTLQSWLQSMNISGEQQDHRTTQLQSSIVHGWVVTEWPMQYVP